MLDIEKVRQNFPVLKRQVAGRPIVYLDSAATYLKPQAVIDAVCECYQQAAGTIGRAVHVMAEDATTRFEDARESIADFINADADEIVFTRNATDAINLVASSLSAGTTILSSFGEHHSNLLPWRNRHQLQIIPLSEDGGVNLQLAEPIIAEATRGLLSISTIGNAFGHVHPIEELTELAHDSGNDVMLDLNQSIAHHAVDVRNIDCDYACFSGHKLGGPTGIGVLYAKRDRLEKLQPTLFGGGMVESVSEHAHVLAEFPNRLEAGTPAFEAVIGLAAACDYLQELGLAAVQQHESLLTRRLLEGLDSIPQITLRGQGESCERGAIVSFQVEGLEAHGAARMLSNRANLCLRSGFHCAQLAHETQDWRPTVRASFGVYNTSGEVDALLESLRHITDNLGNNAHF